MFGNPVDRDGRIQAESEVWKGKPTFRVTSTFAEHVASGRGPGIDIGNGRCGDPVYAMEAGTVTLSGFLGAALVVRIAHTGLTINGQHPETGYAHLTTSIVSQGQTVARGQQIGTHGMSGATACHLHGGCKVGGVEIDWWPLLDQNMTGDDVNASFIPLPNKTTTVNAGARHRTAPTLDPGNIAIGSDPGGPLKFPLSGSVKGSPANGTDLWYVYWRADAGGGPKWLYLHSSVCGPLTPFETVSAPTDCAPAVKAAVDPLKAQLDTVTAISVTQAKKISDAKAALG